MESQWSKVEQAAWDTVAGGDAFDMAAARRGHPDWPAALSSRFMTQLLTCDRLVRKLPGAVAIRNAPIAGSLDLAHLVVRLRLECQGCVFDAVRATESVWNSLKLRDTRILGAVDLSFSRFSASVLLQTVDVADALDLSSARIDGDLTVATAHLGALAADSITVTRSIELRGVDIRADADLWGAEVGRDLVLDSDETGRRTIVGSGVSIESLRKLDAKSPPALNLGSAKIERRVSISDTEVRGPFGMDAVRISEDLWLRNCSAVAGPINLVFAKVGQNIDLSSTILRDADLTGARIGGELRLGAPSGRLTAPVWAPDARLVLRNVQVSSWTDATGNAEPRSPDCVPIPGTRDPWPDRIDVIGFSYENVEGLGGGAAVLQHDADWLCRWLARQTPYSFEPYQHAAGYLKKIGLGHEADGVLYCGKVLQIPNTPGWAGKFALEVQRAFVGFGYHVERSLIWAALFILAGQQIFSRTREAKAHHMPIGLAYSIEMFIPALSLRGIHRDIDLSGWPRYYFYFHKFMGWVLGTYVVATFLGVLGGA